MNRDLGNLSTDAAQAWREGYAAGLAHARAQDPRWCIRDKAVVCASRDCGPLWCARGQGAETRARAPAAAPGCRAPAEAREAVSGEISGQCGGVG